MQRLEVNELIETLPDKLKPVAVMAVETLPIREFCIQAGTLTNDDTGKEYPGFSVLQRGENVKLGYANKVCIAEVDNNFLLVAYFPDGAPPYVGARPTDSTSNEDVVNLMHSAMIPQESMA